eukprot:365151-Chlamydomonas_euryale.AAC.10
MAVTLQNANGDRKKRGLRDRGTGASNEGLDVVSVPQQWRPVPTSTEGPKTRSWPRPPKCGEPPLPLPRCFTDAAPRAAALTAGLSHTERCSAKHRRVPAPGRRVCRARSDRPQHNTRRDFDTPTLSPQPLAPASARRPFRPAPKSARRARRPSDLRQHVARPRPLSRRLRLRSRQHAAPIPVHARQRRSDVRVGAATKAMATAWRLPWRCSPIAMRDAALEAAQPRCQVIQSITAASRSTWVSLSCKACQQGRLGIARLLGCMRSTVDRRHASPRRGSRRTSLGYHRRALQRQSTNKPSNKPSNQGSFVSSAKSLHKPSSPKQYAPQASALANTRYSRTALQPTPATAEPHCNQHPIQLNHTATNTRYTRQAHCHEVGQLQLANQRRATATHAPLHATSHTSSPAAL